MEFPNLFSEIEINGMQLKNRIVMTATHLGYATPEGEVTDRLVEFYLQRVKGGVGLIIVGGCPIDDHVSMANMIRIDDDRYLPGLKRLTQTVKANGVKIGAQIYQAGRYVHSSMIGGRKPVSASAVRSGTSCSCASPSTRRSSPSGRSPSSSSWSRGSLPARWPASTTACCRSRR